MKSAIKYILFFLILFLWVAQLPAQTYTFRNITMSDGLSGLLVNAIFKDSDGFIWLGTDNCLDRFDGVKVTHFTFRGSDIRRKRVLSIAETSGRQLWIGNGLGLWRLNRATSELERIATETIDFSVNALLTDGETLYIGTDKGLFIQSNGQLKQVLTDKNMLAACNRILALNLDKEQNTLWLATVQGLYSYSLTDGEISSWHLDENVPEADYFRCITRIGTTLYLGTMSQGVVCFDTSRQTFSHFSSLGCDVISSISTDGKDLIYVSTDGNGVHFLSHKNRCVVRSICHNVHNNESIRSNSVYSLLVDEKGIVWVGLYQNGLDYSLYQNGLFATYSFPPLFDSQNLSVRAFLNHGKEKLIGSRDGLYYINEATRVVRSFVKPVLSSDLILTMCHYNGLFYVGTYGGGLAVLNPQTLVLTPFQGDSSEIFRKGHIFRLCPDKKGNLWIATSQGLFCYNGQNKQMKHYTSSNSQLPEGNVYEVSFDYTGKGWIGTENGMAIYDPASQSIRSSIFPEGFIHQDKVRVVYEDSKHNILLLPEKGSLFTTTLTMDAFHRMPLIPAIPENAFMSIVEDNLGWLWLGSNSGLVRVRADGEKYDAFTFNDGLPSPTFTNGSAYKDENGILWFGNAKGLLRVDPQQIEDYRKQVHPIIFTDLQANGVSVHDSALKSAQNNLTFSFSDLSYGLPSAMMFEYRLDGVDEEWKLLAAQNSVSYYELSPGDYTFRVRLPGNETSESSIHVRINPLLPLWLWGVIGVLALLGVFLTIKLMKRFSLHLAQGFRKEKIQQETISEVGVSDIPMPTSVLVSPISKPSEEKYKTNRLSEDECKALYGKLIAYMKEAKPYTHAELKIGDLATAIDASSHSLSYVFNQYLNQPYYDFINEYRIAEFKLLVADSHYSRYTLVALAELCGFSSRASFFRSFKKITGITPNEYIRSIGSTNKEEY